MTTPKRKATVAKAAKDSYRWAVIVWCESEYDAKYKYLCEHRPCEVRRLPRRAGKAVRK